MIGSVLIANRGEIARRIIRTAKRMGVRTVAVYSDADASAPHVREADAAVHIGPSPAAESYLRGEKIIAAAKETGAEAIHPGYGFLSENADFAQAVMDAGLIWIGPAPASIRAMGLKDAAKALMAKAGVPVTPGYLGEDQSDARLQKEADAIGYPVLIKAVAGGGGKGMRKVEAASDFAAALGAARREAKAAFSDDRVLLETYVTRPRHIEVQVFGDTHGNVVHLFERDCSLQRRHQKVIEEAPAPGMDAATRAAVTEAAVRAAKAVDYVGAGTVEFIADASQGLRGDRIWFMEMNTRLQVEHPVTEAVTGQDLVEWQLRVASGEALPLKQEEITLTGHAIEARLYAENPAKKFLPSTGKLEHFKLPTTVRVDSAVEQDGAVTPYYDPMIAKLIAHGPSRDDARLVLAKACSAIEVWPVKTNALFLLRCLEHPDFDQADTGFIERHPELVERYPENLAPSAAAYSRLNQIVDASPSSLAGFRLNGEHRPLEFDMYEGDERLSVRATANEGRWLLTVDGFSEELAFVRALSTIGRDPLVVFEEGLAREFRFSEPRSGRVNQTSDGSIRSPMPGRIVSVQVKAGDQVAANAPLLTLEAMKMEHVMTAPFAGVVEEVTAAVGGQVEEGVVLVRVKAAAKGIPLPSPREGRG